MNRQLPRTTICTPADARLRRNQAKAFLEVAELVLDEESDSSYPQVAAALAVLGAIAAADAICGIRLKQMSRGQDHQQAVRLLESVELPGSDLSSRLKRILNDKNRAHYSPTLMSRSDAQSLVRQAQAILQAAERI